MLSALSVAFLWAAVNLLSAALALAAILFYVFAYTLGLKRRTPQNIVWGGIAGCFPVLIGWAAVTGGLAWPPVVLFLVVFFWTPPHYWPLSLRFRDDYAAAGVPMLPVVAEPAVVARQIVAYSWVMVATSLVLVPVGSMGWLYTVAAVVLGVAFLWEAHALSRGVRRGHAAVGGDAAVPRVHHLPRAAVPRGRGGPVPAVLTGTRVPVPCGRRAVRPCWRRRPTPRALSRPPGPRGPS